MTDSLWSYIFIFLLIIIGCFYFYIKFYVYRYWKIRDVEYLSPSFPFGNVCDAIFFRQSINNVIKEVYDKSKSAYTGFFMLFQPTLLVRDRDLIERILYKDFEYFVNRIDCFSDDYPITNNLYTMCDEKWREVRYKMAPVFTPDKLEILFSTVYDIGMTFQRHVCQIADSNAENVIDIGDLSARYLTDVIASIAFGIEVDSISEPNVYFRKIGSLMARPKSAKFNLYYLLIYMIPKLMTKLKLNVIEEEAQEFAFEIVRRTMQYREKNNLSRHDFIQVLIEMRKSSDPSLSIEECSSHIFLFFLAGFETSSSIISFCLYELAKNRNIMQKVQQDIDKALNKHDWKLNYKSIKDMTYLSQCIKGKF